MYSILIVEDDNTIRKGLAKIIKKMDLPIENIYEAENGKDAIVSIDRYNPHIIVSDIKMPQLNGLDFVEHMKKAGSTAKYVILSGYGEFSYAQRAISCDVSEYLLKPVKKDKLYGTLSRLIEQLKQEEQEQIQRLDNAKKIKQYHNVILREIMEGYHNSGEINFILSNADISFPQNGFAVLCIHCRAINDTLLDFLHKHAAPLHIFYCYVAGHSNIICLLNIAQEEYSEVIPLIKEHISAFKTAYSGISEWSDSAASLTELVKHARDALDYRLLDCSSPIFLYSELKKNIILRPALNTYYEEFLNSLHSKYPQELFISIDHLFDFLLRLKPVTPTLIKNSLENLVQYHLPPDKKKLLVNYMTIEHLYQSSESLADFRINLKQMFKNINKFENESCDNRYNNKIAAAIKYIEENYVNNLSLEEVAGYINMNASYFSNIFKKDTGMYFSDFIQKIRVEKSKSLLIQPRYKIYEISEKVGFTDEKYYFKIFKKITGITPTQYRNGLFSDEEHIFEKEVL